MRYTATTMTRGATTHPRRRQRRLAAALTALWLLAAAAPAAAQTCVGDCRGVGRVAISDLVLAVAIALGTAPLEQCPAIGPAPVTVAQLIASVNSALCDCRTCPSPPPTRTFTATPQASATPTATPPPTPRVSTWHEDTLKIPSSTCPRQLTQELRQELAGMTADYTVRQFGDGTVEVEDMNGNVGPATLDANQTLRASETQMQSQGSCVVTLGLDLTVSLASSPSTATYAAAVSSRGCPTMLNCHFQITSRWTRTGAAAGARSTGVAVARSLAIALAGAASAPNP